MKQQPHLITLALCSPLAARFACRPPPASLAARTYVDSGQALSACALIKPSARKTRSESVTNALSPLGSFKAPSTEPSSECSRTTCSGVNASAEEETAS